MAAHASWRGYLKVSLVACPIRLYPAVSEQEKVRFHLINPETGTRIKMITVDPESGDEVDRATLVKGYEYNKNQYVTVSREEIDQIKLESTRTIDIERFVKASDVDTFYCEKPYYLTPDGKVAQEAFKVIAEAMREQGLVGMGRVVIAQRERPLTIEPRGRGIVMTTLRTAAEIRDSAEYFDDITDDAPDSRMVEMAKTIMSQMQGPFDPGRFEDRYEAAVRALVEAKIKGLPVAEQPKPKGAQVIDLMEALKRSIGETPARKAPAAARQARRSASSGKRAGKRRAG